MEAGDRILLLDMLDTLCSDHGHINKDSIECETPSEYSGRGSMAIENTTGLSYCCGGGQRRLRRLTVHNPSLAASQPCVPT